MGRDKADVSVRGRPMLNWVASALAPVTTDVVLLGPDRPGWECWPDSVHAEGPLAGITTALDRADADRVLLVAVDHPFVSTDFLRQLTAVRSDLPVVPVDDSGARQVTCAVYPTSIAAEARQEAEGGGSIQSLLDRVSFHPVAPDQWRSWGEDGRSWFSVDDEEAMQVGVSRYLGDGTAVQ